MQYFSKEYKKQKYICFVLSIESNNLQDSCNFNDKN